MDTYTLRDLLVQEILAFSGLALGAIDVPLIDDVHQVYGLVSVDYPSKKWDSDFVMLASIEGNKIIIERDSMDTQLTQGLLYNGVPREQLILAYNDEIVPELETTFS